MLSPEIQEAPAADSDRAQQARAVHGQADAVVGPQQQLWLANLKHDQQARKDMVARMVTETNRFACVDPDGSESLNRVNEGICNLIRESRTRRSGSL